MHFTNRDVTNEGFLNNYLDSSSNNYPLTLNSRIKIIAGLHSLDNQYLPNEVIAGWFGEEPENGHPIPLNDHHDEDLSYDAHGRSERNHETLLQALAESRAEVIELRVRQRVYERHLLDMERQLAELRVHQRDDRRQ